MRKKRVNIIEEEYKQYGEDGYEFVSNSWFESQKRAEGSFLPKLLQILSALVLGIVLVILVKIGYQFWFKEDALVLAQDQKSAIKQENEQKPSLSIVKERSANLDEKRQEVQTVAANNENHENKQKLQTATESMPQPDARHKIAGEESVTNRSNLNQDHPAQVQQIEKSPATLEGEKLVQYLLSLPPDQLEKIDVKKLLLSKKTPKVENEYLNNQAVVEKKEVVIKNDELARLSEELESIIEPEVKKVEANVPATDKKYIKGLKKEVAVRKKSMRYYEVRPGDTLSKIARKFYGSGKEYIRIYEANQDIITKPELIFPGQRLRIPAI